MPLMIFDILKGRSRMEISSMLTSAHEAMLKTFRVPERDRYQIVIEHEPHQLITLDTGLNLQRTKNITIVRVITRFRPREQKQAFFRLLTEKLENSCGISPADVIVTLTVNGDDDWSFGLGRAQFLTQELAAAPVAID